MSKAKQPAQTNASPKPRREKLISSVIRCAEQLATAHALATPDDLNLLSNVLIELSNATGVHVDNPRIVATFYKEAIHAFHHQQFAMIDDGQAQRRTFRVLDDVDAVLSFITNTPPRRRHATAPPPDIEAIRAKYEGDDEPDTGDDVEATHRRDLAPVIDLQCWRESRPRPIRNLLFAARPAIPAST
jgi:hypothetical protein